MSQNIKVIPRPSNSLRDKLYLPAIADGIKVTFKHLFENVNDINAIETLRYPEEQPSDITTRYRGLHRLTHRKDGTEACVACFMCATACPSNCIFIEAQEREDGLDEKRPKSFFIDTLECIFCGYCVEACPCDAIRMDTGIFSLTGNSRKDFVMDKERLLSHKGAFSEEVSCARG